MEVIGLKVGSFILDMITCDELPARCECDVEIDDNIFLQIIGVLSFWMISLYTLNNTTLRQKKSQGRSIRYCCTRLPIQSYKQGKLQVDQLKKNAELNPLFLSNGMSRLADQFTCRRVNQWKNVQSNLEVLESNETHGIGKKKYRRSKSQRNSQRANRTKQLFLIKRNSNTSNEKLSVPFDCKLTTGNSRNNKGDLKNTVLIENEQQPGKNIDKCLSSPQAASFFARNKHENVSIKVLSSSTKEHTFPTHLKSTLPVCQQSHIHPNQANQSFSAEHCNTFMKSLARHVKKFTMSMNKSSLVKLLTGEIYWVNNDGDHNMVSCGGKHYPVDSVEYLTQIKSFTPIELAVSRMTRDDINPKRNKGRVYSMKRSEKIPHSSSNCVKGSEMNTDNYNSSFKKWTNKLTEIKTVSPIHFSVCKDRFSTMCNNRRPDHRIKTKHPSNQTSLPRENKANKNVGISDEINVINVDCDYVNPVNGDVIPKEKYFKKRDEKKRFRNIHHLSNKSQEHGSRLSDIKTCCESELICLITSAGEAQSIQKGAGDSHLSKYCFLSVNESGEQKRNTEIKRKNKTTDETLGFQIEHKSKRDAVQNVTFSPTSNGLAYERVLLEFQSRLEKVDTEKSNYQLKDLFRNLKSMEETGESHISLAMSLSGVQSLREKGGYCYIDDSLSTLPDSCISSAKFETVHKQLSKTQSNELKEYERVWKKSLQNNRKHTETCKQKNLVNLKSRNPPYCSTTCNIITFSSTKSRRHNPKQIRKKTDRHGKHKQTCGKDLQNICGRKYNRRKFQRTEQNKCRKLNRKKYYSVPECMCAEKCHRLGVRREYIARQDRLFFRKYHTSSDCISSYISDESDESLCSIF